jgi:ATP-dependent DNA helicase RecQ
VLRVQERFGAEYVSLVLVGSQDERIMSAGHNELSTWGLLRDFRRQDVRQWIEQLVNQGFLCKEGEYHTVRVTDDGRRLLRGEGSPTLLRPTKQTRGQTSAAGVDSWEGVDRDLFDALRQLRREVASERGVPAYIVFGDATLREMARRRPSTLSGLLEVRGVGRQKLADVGQQFLDRIVSHCRDLGLETDVAPPIVAPRPIASAPTANAILSFPLFDEGLSAEQVAERLGRASSTTYGYLEMYIRQRCAMDATQWISPDEFQQIETAAQACGTERLKPIFETLDGRIGYERIRIALACLANRAARSTSTAQEAAT